MSTVASTHDDTYSQRSGSTANEHYQFRNQEEDHEVKMSDRYFKKLFRENFGLYYNTFELNEKLYLHYKGFRCIENLERFPDLKCIYLEGNGFTKIEGLGGNPGLRSLYIQENLFEKIENLDHLKDLHYLNLNDNYIKTIENLSGMSLETLQIKKNRVGMNGISDLMGLLEIPTLSVLDISENNIDDPAIIDDVLVHMPNLRVLYLKGNPVCKQIRNYKKSIIAKMPELRYLDDSPVFPEDRRYAEAFKDGGMDAEREERKKVKKEKDDAHWKNHEAFREMIRLAKENKKIKEAENKEAADKEETKEEQKVESKVEELQLTEEKQPIEKEHPIDQVDDQKNEQIDDQEETIQTTKAGVKKQDAQDKQEVHESTPDTNDQPPELEEVTMEQLATEKENKKVQELINQIANKQPDDAKSDASNKGSSVVDVEDIIVQNSNSISLSVTSETSELHNRAQTEESHEDKLSESEEERHLEDSASDAEESIKTEPGKVQSKLNDTDGSAHNHSNQKPIINKDEEGEYLDDLD
jgi:dynein assembly factor 1